MTNEERDYFERIASSLNYIAISLMRMNQLKAVEIKSKENISVNEEVNRIMKGA